MLFARHPASRRVWWDLWWVDFGVLEWGVGCVLLRLRQWGRLRVELFFLFGFHFH